MEVSRCFSMLSLTTSKGTEALFLSLCSSLFYIITDSMFKLSEASTFCACFVIELPVYLDNCVKRVLEPVVWELEGSG